MSIEAIRIRLFSMQDLVYRDFQARLMPTVEKSIIIGVRTPLLRAYAKEIKDTPDAAAFLNDLPHTYYEENNLHAFLIEFIRDYDACIAALDAFLPCVDNWATCDSMAPKVLGRYPNRLLVQTAAWMASPHTYTVRFGIGMLMRHFLDENFCPEVLDRVASVRSEGYYINMMIAWFFATALAKQWDATLPYIQNERLDAWTRNKAIQKAVESYRISPEQKAYLKTLKKSLRKES